MPNTSGSVKKTSTITAGSNATFQITIIEVVDSGGNTSQSGSDNFPLN